MKWTISTISCCLIMLLCQKGRPIKLKHIRACTVVCNKTGICGPSVLQFRFFTCHLKSRRKHFQSHGKETIPEQRDDLQYVKDINCLGKGPNSRNLSATSCAFEKCEITSRHVITPTQKQDSSGTWVTKLIASEWYNCFKSNGQQISNCGKEEKQHNETKLLDIINQHESPEGKGDESKNKRNVTGYTELRGGKSIVLVKLYDDRKPWDDALKVCEADGGTLLKIDSKYIQVQIGKKFPLRGSEWIGLKDIYKNNTFFWTDKTLPSYTNWIKNQPSNGFIDVKHFSFRNEDCVQLKGTRYQWNDCACDSSKSFLCQM